MKANVENIDWNTLTRSDACILRRVARNRENMFADRVNEGEDCEAEWRRWAEVEEDLSVFILTGERPNGLTAVA